MKRATIKDVAAAAGVSAQTVSRVVNGHASVLPATRLRVEAAIEELAYRPSAVARGLQSNRTNTVGVLLWGTQYFGPAETLLGIVEECTRQGLTVLISELPEIVDFDPERALDMLLQQRVDGIIMSVPQVGATIERITAALTANELPVVFVRVGTPERYSGVELDNRAAMRSVVDHLVGLGRTRIAHIAGPEWWDEATERRAGWRSALDTHGLPAPDSYVEPGDWSAESGAAAADRLLSRHPDLDAIVSANDRMALGALRVLGQRGIEVPEQVALTGFDDIPEIAWVTPSITSVAQPLHAIGSEAVRTLLDHLDDPRRPTAVTTLRAELIERESTIGRAAVCPEHLTRTLGSHSAGCVDDGSERRPPIARTG